MRIPKMAPIGDQHWMDDGDCTQLPAEWWFPEERDEETAAKAKGICAECPVRIQCLEFALQASFASDYGIWGGTDRFERRRLRKRYKAAGQSNRRSVK